MENYLENYVWDSKFWLPKNYTWKELSFYVRYGPRYSIYYPILTAIALFIFRILFEKFVAKPIAKWMGIKEKSQPRFTRNAQLEVYYVKEKKMSEALYMHIARETEISVDEVKSWFQARNALNKTTKMKKFTEGCWRLVFYSFIWLYGVKTMSSKSWTWDSKQFWINYPKHTVTDDIYWYYTLELGFYMSLFVTQFFDIKRKDFWQMFVHHLVAIVLLVLSYTCNFTRTGTFVFLLHDCVDIWLEIAKLSLYVKAQRLCDIAFGIFTLIWFITRLVIYPFWVLRSTFFEGPVILGDIPRSYYLFNAFLSTFFVLHVFWFIIIARIAYRSVILGKIEKDDRSESDVNSDLNNDTEKDK